MPRDVTQSLANALPDSVTVRRGEARTGSGKTPSSPDSAEATTPRFDRMVSTEAHQAWVAEQARRRQSSQRDERSVPDTSPRNAPTRPEPDRADRSARSDEKASRKDDRTPNDDAATVNREEHTTCSPKSETGGKSVETGDAGADAKSTDEPIVSIGLAEKNSGEAVASPEVTSPEVARPEVSDAVLLAEALLAAQSSADQSSADPSVAVGGNAADMAGSGAAGSVTPGAIGAAVVAQASLVGVATGEAVTAGVTPLPEGVTALATPAVQAQNTAKADIAAEFVAIQSDPEQAGGADAALQAASKTARQDTKIAEGADGATEGDKTVSAAETGKGEKAETLVNKSTVPNLHPTRAAHFADFLDAFGGSSAIHRPADILAGLDRSLVASALNRGAEVTRPTPLQMLPIEIGMQAVRGVTSFQIRLDPAELGRIDVKLQIRDSGEVNASLVVDRVETLQMLKRDASSLEFAFEQAGLKQSPDGLTFSLRGEGQSGQGANQRQSGAPDELIDDAALAAQIGEVAMRRVLIPNSSIDRMV